MPEQTLDTMRGVVSQVAHKDGEATGVKLEGREEAWVNFTQKQWRGTPFDIPERGQDVKLGVYRDKNDRLWVKTVQVLSAPAFENGAVPTSGKDLSITRSVAIKSAVDAVAALISAKHPRYDGEDVIIQLGVDIPALASALEAQMVRKAEHEYQAED